MAKETNIKNWTYYFFNDLINVEKFDSSLLKADKKSYKKTDIYNNGYITIKKIDDHENTHSVLFCCIWLLIMQMDILKKKMEINTWFWWFC